MSVIVKYSSAFTPVSKTTKPSAFKHPFSINSLLSLDEKSRHSHGREAIKPLTPYPPYIGVFPPPSQSVPDRDSIRRAASPLRYSNGEPEASYPAWVYATRYCREGIPPGTFINARRPRKPLKKHKQRPLFSQKQIQRLEEEFANEKYISKSRRSTLASEIELTDAQVRTWFQNRRTRWRKEVQGDDDMCHPEMRQPWAAPPCTDELRSNSAYGLNCLVVRGYCRL